MIAKGCLLRNQDDIASTGRHHGLERQSGVATPRQAFLVRFWSEADMLRAAGAYRSDENDPNVWSGRALQDDFSELADVRSCINVSGL
jgi:hypothetical protein